MAASLAEAGKKVLFLDADLRKSVLMGRHRVAGEVKGLSHFLSGQVEIKDIILKTQEPNLYVAFAGVVPPNPSELLGNRRFEALLNGARQAYDYVIIVRRLLETLSMLLSSQRTVMLRSGCSIQRNQL